MRLTAEGSRARRNKSTEDSRLKKNKRTLIRKGSKDPKKSAIRSVLAKRNEAAPRAPNDVYDKVPREFSSLLSICLIFEFNDTALDVG